MLEVDRAGGVTHDELLALWAGVRVEEVLEAVLAQGALAALPAEVEAAAEMRAGVGARVALVERRGDAAAVEGQEEGEAAEATADDGDAGVGRVT